MRDNDLHQQRLQQRTVGLALAGLEKGELFVLKKTIGFALTKADWFALTKADWFALRKRDGSLSKKRFFAFKKAFCSL